MAFLRINGYDLPMPARGVSIKVVTVVDAGRNAAGEVVGQRIGRDQYKIDGLQWGVLRPDEWQSILQAMSDFYFPVTFPDPVTGFERTVIMYCGDRSAEIYFTDEYGKPSLYRNCSVNLIDTGKDTL